MAAPRPPEFLGLPNPVVNGIPVVGPWLTSGSDVVSGAKKAVNAVEWLSDSHNWVRMGEALVGVLLIGIGINAMLKGSPVGQSVNNVASLATGPLKAKQVASSAARRAGAVESARLSARAAAKGVK